MNSWGHSIKDPIDAELLEEASLAMAQSLIQNAIDRAGITKAELARKMNRPRSFVSLMLSGTHNLTIKTMSRAMVACGFQIKFDLSPISWTWKSHVPANKTCGISKHDQVPAQAGTTRLVASATRSVVPGSITWNFDLVGVH